MESLLKKRIVFIGIIMFFFQTLFYIAGWINGDSGLYLRSISLYCGTIAISLAIITLFMKSNSFYKYLGISFWVIGFLEYLKILLNAMISDEEFMKARVSIEYCIDNFEYICVLLAVIYLLKEFKNTGVIIINIITLILTICYTNFFLTKSFGILNFFIVGSSIFFITLIILKKKNISDYRINSYMLCILLSNVIKIIINYETSVFMIIPMSLKMLAYFNVYQGICENCVAIETSTIKEKVKVSKKEKKHIYNKIKSRRNIINELENMQLRGETYYYQIIDGFSDGIIIYGEQIKYLNERAKEVFRIKDKESLDQLILEGKTKYKMNSWPRKIKVKDKNGQDINIEISVDTIENSIKIIYFKEVNEIIEYEESLRRYESFLRYENMKNEFYANVSHELRTPINVISSALELNELKIKNKDFNGIRESNIMIKKNCLRLIRTINNFIDANRFTEGCANLNKKNHNIIEVVEEIVLASVPYIRERGIEVIFDATDEEIILNIDRDMIERVILNLLSNSLKYGKNDCEKIDVEMVKYEKNLYIIISNNGTRIRKTDEKYIFDKFSVVSNKLNRENEGSGLGLFLCKEIINAHGGEIYLSSDNKCRNEFVIELTLEENLKLSQEIRYNINGLDEKVKIEFSDIN